METNCGFYDKDFDCCKLFSDWSYPTPIIEKCTEKCSRFKLKNEEVDEDGEDNK